MGGSGGWVAACGGLIQSSQQDRKLTYKAIITLSEKPCSVPFAFQSRNKKCGLFIFVCFVFVWGFFIYFCCFVFLVQHNLEHLKAFQPKCGGKTGKALFLHKTSIPNSANESGTS